MDEKGANLPLPLSSPSLTLTTLFQRTMRLRDAAFLLALSTLPVVLAQSSNSSTSSAAASASASSTSSSSSASNSTIETTVILPPLYECEASTWQCASLPPSPSPSSQAR
jgi:hypothetical protein